MVPSLIHQARTEANFNFHLQHKYQIAVTVFAVEI